MNRREFLVAVGNAAVGAAVASAVPVSRKWKVTVVHHSPVVSPGASKLLSLPLAEGNYDWKSYDTGLGTLRYFENKFFESEGESVS